MAKKGAKSKLKAKKAEEPPPPEEEEPEPEPGPAEVFTDPEKLLDVLVFLDRQSLLTSAELVSPSWRLVSQSLDAWDGLTDVFYQGLTVPAHVLPSLEMAGPPQPTWRQYNSTARSDFGLLMIEAQRQAQACFLVPKDKKREPEAEKQDKEADVPGAGKESKEEGKGSSAANGEGAEQGGGTAVVEGGAAEAAEAAGGAEGKDGGAAKASSADGGGAATDGVEADGKASDAPGAFGVVVAAGQDGKAGDGGDDDDGAAQEAEEDEESEAVDDDDEEDEDEDEGGFPGDDAKLVLEVEDSMRSTIDRWRRELEPAVAEAVERSYMPWSVADEAEADASYEATFRFFGTAVLVNGKS